MRCTNCGNTIPPNVKFCAYCGAVAGAPTPVSKPRRGLPTWLKWIIGLLAVPGLVVVVMMIAVLSRLSTPIPSPSPPPNPSPQTITLPDGSSYARNDLPTSPSGQIVFSLAKDSSSGIYVADSDGTNITRLTPEDMVDWCPCWLPDGSKIVFSSLVSTEYGSSFRIFMMNPDGTDRTELVFDAKKLGIYDYDHIAPLVNPQGSTIAFVVKLREGMNLAIYTMDILNLNRNMYEVHQLTQWYEFSLAFAWLSASEIVYTALRWDFPLPPIDENFRLHLENADIYVANLFSGSREYVLNPPPELLEGKYVRVLPVYEYGDVKDLRSGRIENLSKV